MHEIKQLSALRKIILIWITSRAQNGQESAIFNSGWRLSNELRLPWIDTNWIGEGRFKSLLCQVGPLLSFWCVCLFLSSWNLQFEIPCPMKEFSLLIFIPLRNSGHFWPTNYLWRKTIIYSQRRREDKNAVRSTKWFILSHLMPTFTLTFCLEWGQINICKACIFVLNCNCLG